MPDDDQIEEEIITQNDSPLINATTKQGQGQKGHVLQPTQQVPSFLDRSDRVTDDLSPGGIQPYVRGQRNTEMHEIADRQSPIEEEIEQNPNETTNGAAELQMNETNASDFFQVPLQGGVPVFVMAERRPFTPPFAQLAQEIKETTIEEKKEGHIETGKFGAPITEEIAHE